MYTPLSPAHEVHAYQPNSPRLGNSRVERIIGKIRANKPPQFRKSEFVPLCNYRAQLHAIRLSGEFTDEYVDALLTKHDDFYAMHPDPTPRPRNEPIRIPECSDDTITTTKTLKNGTTKTKTEAPLAEIGKKNIFKVPVNDYIVAMKKFGYPNWVLEQTLERYQQVKKDSGEYEKVFNQVFSSYNATKPSKPKKKHIRDRARKFAAKTIQLDDDDK